MLYDKGNFVKKLNILTIKYFIGPFVVTFFISMFVLIMQFLWKYIDDMAGKGLEWYVIIELLFYASAHLVPLALPLAVLLSSIMTFGAMAENNELIAAKSAGVSLFRIIKPLWFIIFFIAFGAFLFSNYTLPKANLQFGALLWDVKTKKPAFDLKPGIFYTGIDNYAIRIAKKDNSGKHLENILIYDHTKGMENNIVIRAKKGEMELSDNEQWLTLTLWDGIRYEEIRNMKDSYKTFPASKTVFKEYTMRFDLSSFQLDRTDVDLFKGNFKMLRMDELAYLGDSVRTRQEEIDKTVRRYLKPHLYFLRDSLIDDKDTHQLHFTEANFIDNFPENQKSRIIKQAAAGAKSIKYVIQNPRVEYEFMRDNLIRYQIEWHRKIIISFVIIFLFLIGAPMGAIIRKGGLGLPSVVSIFLFIAFYIISIMGEKLARKYLLTPFVGMWLPVFIIAPISIYLVFKSNRDSLIFRGETILDKIRKQMNKVWFLDTGEKVQ